MGDRLGTRSVVGFLIAMDISLLLLYIYMYIIWYHLLYYMYYIILFIILYTLHIYILYYIYYDIYISLYYYNSSLYIIYLYILWFDTENIFVHSGVWTRDLQMWRLVHYLLRYWGRENPPQKNSQPILISKLLQWRQNMIYIHFLNSKN